MGKFPKPGLPTSFAALIWVFSVNPPTNTSFLQFDLISMMCSTICPPQTNLGTWKMRCWKVSEPIFVIIGKGQNRKVSELASVHIEKCQKWKMLELKSVKTKKCHNCSKLERSESESVRISGMT